MNDMEKNLISEGTEDFAAIQVRLAIEQDAAQASQKNTYPGEKP